MESGSCCDEWKKMVYPCNIQPTETWCVGIMLNENTIMSCRTTQLRVNGLNTFMKHPPCARQVTWGIINGNRKGKTQILVVLVRTGQSDSGTSSSLYQLFMKEAPNKVWKVRDIEMDTKTFNHERKISNCTIA